MNSYFNNMMFNPQYVNPDYYNQIQQFEYNQNQDKKIRDVSQSWQRPSFAGSQRFSRTLPN